jgi:hypothetical protein
VFSPGIADNPAIAPANAGTTAEGPPMLGMVLVALGVVAIGGGAVYYFAVHRLRE